VAADFEAVRPDVLGTPPAHRCLGDAEQLRDLVQGEQLAEVVVPVVVTLVAVAGPGRLLSTGSGDVPEGESTALIGRRRPNFLARDARWSRTAPSARGTGVISGAGATFFPLVYDYRSGSIQTDHVMVRRNQVTTDYNRGEYTYSDEGWL
jgi:hypothetical protein